MKIISAPKLEQWTKQATCLTCLTVVELDYRDLHSFHSDQREGSSCQWTCPTCKRSVYENAENIPSYVKIAYADGRLK
jgi:hypothetical protein